MNINSIMLIIKVILLIAAIVVIAKGFSAIEEGDSKNKEKIGHIIGAASLILAIFAISRPALLEEWLKSLPWMSSNEDSTENEAISKKGGTVDHPEEEPEERVLPSVIPDTYYVYDGHTYGFYNADNLGLDAYHKVSEFCREQGGHLATINNTSENSFLFNILRKNHDETAFFGYSDETEEGNWQWDYGNSSYVNWTKYGQQQPDDGAPHGTSEDYAEFNYDGNKEPSYNVPSDGTWNDAVFKRNTNLFICEWEFYVEKELNNN